MVKKVFLPNDLSRCQLIDFDCRKKDTCKRHLCNTGDRVIISQDLRYYGDEFKYYIPVVEGSYE